VIDYPYHVKYALICSGEAMIHVKYQDNSYDYVDDVMLDYLIASDSIKEFYRASDAEWVDVNEAPIRGEGLSYIGPERRRSPACLKIS
jgi:hypothetical protein